MRSTGTDDPTRWDWELAAQDEDARLLAERRYGWKRTCGCESAIGCEHDEEETTP